MFFTIVKENCNKRPVVPNEASSKLENINPNEMNLNFMTDSWLRSRYKKPPGVIKMAIATPTLIHILSLNQSGHGANHMKNQTIIRDRIQTIVLPEKVMFAVFFMDCVIAACLESKFGKNRSFLID